MTSIFPKSISDVQYICPTSDIYIRCPIYISDVGYPCPSPSPSPCSSPSPCPSPCSSPSQSQGILYHTSDIDIGHPIQILDVGYRYWMSDIDIGRLIYTWDIRYRFRKYWCHLVLNGARPIVESMQGLTQSQLSVQTNIENEQLRVQKLLINEQSLIEKKENSKTNVRDVGGNRPQRTSNSNHNIRFLGTSLPWLKHLDIVRATPVDVPHSLTHTRTHTHINLLHTSLDRFK